MKPYTVRYAHLEDIPNFDIGDNIFQGNKICRMGNTGSSTAPHLHIDVVKGFRNTMYRLAEIAFDVETIRQLGYFIDRALFKFKIIVTASFGEPTYLDRNDKWKMHPAYDVVPENRHYEPGRNFDIYWNRSKEGFVLKVGFDSGYGNYILIGFEA